MDDPEPTEAEVALVLQAVLDEGGGDFRGYARSSLRRRIGQRVIEERVEGVSGLLTRAREDRPSFDRLLDALSVPATEMFRDPPFWRSLRSNVAPLLRELPAPRAWSAGCATGEEPHSLAIVLEEEGLYRRARIYATDVNDALLERARSGFLPLPQLKEYTARYQQAGGSRSFSDWYTARYDAAILRSALRHNTVFAVHNLATDASFNEFHLVLCRNVMIYFNRELCGRVFRLLDGSLALGGVLGLGRGECMALSGLEARYEVLDAENRLYRKVA